MSKIYCTPMAMNESLDRRNTRVEQYWSNDSQIEIRLRDREREDFESDTSIRLESDMPGDVAIAQLLAWCSDNFTMRTLD